MVESSRIADRGPVRADARRNRELVLVAARAVFAEHGIDAPMAAVARRAGVGVATLYRHFPTREALVRGAFSRQMRRCGQVLVESLADPDPWRGFCRLIETVCELQREERGFPEAFVAAFPDTSAEHAEARARADEGLGALVRRAQAVGALRPDFRPSDLAVVLLAHGGLVAAVPEDGAASRRLVAYLLESFRAAPSNGPLPPASSLSLGNLPAADGRPSGA